MGSGIIMDKRANFGDYATLTIILNSFLVIFALVTLAMLVNYSVSYHVDTTQLRVNLFVTRVIYSNNGISYTDQTGRIYPGTIDPERLSIAILNNYLDYKNNRLISANITLYTDDGAKVKSVMYNKEMYSLWQPLVFTNDYFERNINRYVLIKDKQRLVPGKLVVDVVTPRG